ncbi:hypothetical protein GCM10011492_02000 [Flexivirga endophytica]|uniref:Uncharacterized protein n=1 Tax=Flexivirga endophytica TaxID=1849103 RepID=A0A916WNW2_9MICO|nr:hypothetical protein [Flexivirga endophytica]GGB15889.1 hypothetical protein GCM10011492_02000 [Flexivirga endophytica]GHB39707.1 hypothetical protein GCM10008112_05610 [Flexivirga endophytica]
MSTQQVPVAPGSEAAERSRLVAITVAVVGLVGMFVALLGWTGVAKDVDSTIGLPPWLIFVVGAVVVVGAAVFDLAAGARSDVYVVAPDQQLTTMQFILNKLAPWIIVALTVVGMIAIWLRHH